MILLVSGATRTMRQRTGSQHLGHLIVPGAGNSIDKLLETGLPLAADNGAFSFFDEAAFLRMLGKLQGKPALWVTAPDVVGDAAVTLALFEVWEPIIRSYGLPVTLVGQDGLEVLAVPRERMDALFIGGSTAWKLGPGAAALVGDGAVETPSGPLGHSHPALSTSGAGHADSVAGEPSPPHRCRSTTAKQTTGGDHERPARGATAL